MSGGHGSPEEITAATSLWFKVNVRPTCYVRTINRNCAIALHRTIALRPICAGFCRSRHRCSYPGNHLRRVSVTNGISSRNHVASLCASGAATRALIRLLRYNIRYLEATHRHDDHKVNYPHSHVLKKVRSYSCAAHGRPTLANNDMSPSQLDLTLSCAFHPVVISVG